MLQTLFLFYGLLLKTNKCQSQEYKLIDSYIVGNFFNQFEFVNGGEAGMNESYAMKNGFISYTNTTQIYMSADYKSYGWPRPSLYLYGKNHYDNGLFIIDLDHMPQGCGTWPAFWFDAPNWPNDGEVDVIEGVNLFESDQTSLHTSSNCSYDKIENTTNYEMSGYWVWTNCTSYHSNITNVTNSDGGCSVWANNSLTYGKPFNDNNGGVFAMELNDNIGIRSWFWTHNNVPEDITNKKPKPNNKNWGIPYAYFPFGEYCSSNHFKQLLPYFGLNFCEWAGYDITWKQQCASRYGNECETYVANNPSDFKEAYWLVNYFDVYQLIQ